MILVNKILKQFQLSYGKEKALQKYVEWTKTKTEIANKALDTARKHQDTLTLKSSLKQGQTVSNYKYTKK